LFEILQPRCGYRCRSARKIIFFKNSRKGGSMNIFGLLKRTRLLVFFLIGLVVIFSGLKFDRVNAAGPSEQVIFSGNGTFNEGSSLAGTPFGFWIWCQPEGNGPYVSECKGAMYIYALHLTKHVEDAEEPGIIESSEGIYVMTVASKDGSIFAELENTEEAVSGPNNTVNVKFTTPDVGSGTSTNAVVNVTGPKD
jgi:hypothetical protein